jgi:hypothetical protein
MDAETLENNMQGWKKKKCILTATWMESKNIR